MAKSRLGPDAVRLNATSQPKLRLPPSPRVRKQSPNLRIAISAALHRHGIPPSRFGRDAVNDPAFYRDVMHRGRELRPVTESRVRAFMAALDGEA